ncbi:unnamed protein product [Nezara viridula]|uniref:Sulfotransferase domain-containing protein n=1 Tax=Nezara viridula TaxID=85310 RepID=A0A9P0HGT7_NEZVI|nr:unnamed protein product [Nezara viridula]
MFPYEIKPLDDKLNKEQLHYFKGERSGFCQVGPDKWFLPISFKKHAEAFYNLELKEDDIFIVTFPRTGTTITQELIWMINNNFDYEKSSKIPLFTKFPFLDLDVLIHDDFGKEMFSKNTDPEILEVLKLWKTPVDKLSESTPSPRHFKTHMPFSLLPKNLLDKCKVIYLARNMKDVALSYYYHNKLIKLHDYTGDFERYWNYFKNDLVVYGPYWRHIEEGWERKEHPNLMFLFYEDIIKDMKNVIRNVAKFLGKQVTDSDVDGLYNHLQIANFSKNVPIFAKSKINGWLNESDEGFIRKGDSRGKSEFTDEIKKEAEEWEKEKCSKNHIVFPKKS